MERIHRSAFSLSRYAIPPHLLNFTIKLTTRWLPVGTRQVKDGNALATCHLCGEIKTHRHLFQCPQKRQAHDKLAALLAEFLQTIQTQEHIQVAIVTGIHGWLLNQPAEEDRATLHQNVCAAYDAQTVIGWENTFAGIAEPGHPKEHKLAETTQRMDDRPGPHDLDRTMHG
jgi:hypothetical protein